MERVTLFRFPLLKVDYLIRGDVNDLSVISNGRDYYIIAAKNNNFLQFIKNEIKNYEIMFI
jgi:hypothetical protein